MSSAIPQSSTTVPTAANRETASRAKACLFSQPVTGELKALQSGHCRRLLPDGNLYCRKLKIGIFYPCAFLKKERIPLFFFFFFDWASFGLYRFEKGKMSLMLQHILEFVRQSEAFWSIIGYAPDFLNFVRVFFYPFVAHFYKKKINILEKHQTKATGDWSSKSVRVNDVIST